MVSQEMHHGRMSRSDYAHFIRYLRRSTASEIAAEIEKDRAEGKHEWASVAEQFMQQ
jgi:hypothetical protein